MSLSFHSVKRNRGFTTQRPRLLAKRPTSGEKYAKQELFTPMTGKFKKSAQQCRLEFDALRSASPLLAPATSSTSKPGSVLLPRVGRESMPNPENLPVKRPPNDWFDMHTRSTLRKFGVNSTENLLANTRFRTPPGPLALRPMPVVNDLASTPDPSKMLSRPEGDVVVASNGSVDLSRYSGLWQQLGVDEACFFTHIYVARLWKGPINDARAYTSWLYWRLAPSASRETCVSSMAVLNSATCEQGGAWVPQAPARPPHRGWRHAPRSSHRVLYTPGGRPFSNDRQAPMQGRRGRATWHEGDFTDRGVQEQLTELAVMEAGPWARGTSMNSFEPG